MKTHTDGTLEHVRHLAVDIGCRPIGSAANLLAADYIDGVFQGAGLSVQRQDFSAPCWTPQDTVLQLGNQVLDASPNSFSPACDISAPTVPVCTLAELEAAPIRGRIVVFYGALAQGELATKAGIYIPDRDRRIVNLLEDQKPAGIITVNPTLHARWRLIEDFDLDIPSVTVTAPSGLALLQAPGAPAEMKISASRSTSHSANIVGIYRGEEPEHIVFCAHYDTKFDTPGAYDNAAGVGVLLSLAQHLAERRPRHTVECIAFSGEEGAGLGDIEYARRSPHAFDNTIAALNFDGVGPFTGTTTAAVFAASEAMEAAFDAAVRAYPGVQRVEPWPASDHYVFYSHGTPSVALSSMGIRDIYHTPSDTLEWISPEKLDEVMQLALDLIEVIDAESLSWSRPGTGTQVPG